MQDAELARQIGDWQRRVWEQIYLRHASSAREALAQAWREWHAMLASPDSRRALQIYLQLLDFDCAASFATVEAERHTLIHKALGLVEPRERTAQASSCRARVVLILRCQAHLLGARMLGVEEARQLLHGLPESTLGHQTCMFLALWAFSVRSQEYLELAYRLFLENPYDFMLDFSRQRVRVMLSLVERRCSHGELAALVETLPHPMHVAWLESCIVPEAQSQGLWSTELEQCLTDKQRVLTERGISVPPRTPAAAAARGRAQ